MRTTIWKKASVIGIMAGLLSLGVSAGIYAEDIAVIDEVEDLEELVPVEISEDMVVPDDGSESEDIVESEGPDPYESVEGLIEDNTGDEEALFAAASIKESGECGNRLTWTLDSEGLLTISGTGAMMNYSLFSGCRSPFYNNQNIKKVVIEDGATSIGNNVFSGCSKIISVIIPDSVTSIGDYVFYNCSGLHSVTIPDSVTYIGECVFECCYGLASINIPAGVTTIGDNAFESCTYLTSVGIPEGVESIGMNAFRYCENLRSVVIPDSVTSIGERAFEYCYGLTSINIPDNVTTIGKEAFYYCTSLTSINIPAGVTTIGDSAFYGCGSLTSVVISEGVESIGESAFTYCENLRSIVIPDSITSIANNAFYQKDAPVCLIVSDVDAFKEKFPEYSDKCVTMSEKEETDSVILLIDSLPSTTTYADREAVENARAAYDALSYIQQSMIPETTLKKLKDAEDFLNHTHDSNYKTYMSCDNEYHFVCFTCKVCREYFKIKEKHDLSDYRYHGTVKVDKDYHANEYECNDCGANIVDIDNKSRHDYSSVACIRKATLTTRGVVKYTCWSCGATKNVAISWKQYDDNSVSYDPWNASIYKNAKKITVYLTNPLKGSVLKVKVGKKTYTKKINNYKKKIKIKIKKAKYGSKINIQLLYKGRVVGRSETDYVWYAKKLRKGMTKKQAKWTWGWTDDTSSSSGGWSYWFYGDGSYIGFKNGRVRYWYDAEG